VSSKSREPIIDLYIEFDSPSDFFWEMEAQGVTETGTARVRAKSEHGYQCVRLELRKDGAIKSARWVRPPSEGWYTSRKKKLEKLDGQRRAGGVPEGGAAAERGDSGAGRKDAR
jgi:hypothetical protein